MNKLAFLLLAVSAPAWLGAVSAPTGLTVTSIQSDQSAVLSWTNDPVAQQWFIYLDGALVYQPYVANTTLNGSQRQFTMNALPYRSPITVNMKALAPPNPISGFSASVSTYAQPVAPIPVSCVAGCLSGTVSVSLTGTVNVTGTVSVLQGGPLTVSGSVGVSGFVGVTIVAQGPTLGVSVLAGVSGLSVTASQDHTWSVSGTSIPLGSDAALALYTTVPAGTLPTTPYYLSQFGPGYDFGVCTTCTAGARFSASVRFNSAYVTSVSCAVTMSTGAQGVSMCFLTPAARTRTYIFNPSASGKVLRYLQWPSATAPLVDPAILQEITPGACVALDDALTYVHLFSPGGTPSTAALVQHVTDTKWTGTAYP